jgi:hypothetical protein
MTGNKN